MIFVSYYTKNTPYEEVMKTHLLPTLEQYCLPHDIIEVPDLGNWSANTSYKATFLLDMLLKWKQDIVFLDADATIEQMPVLFDEIPNEYDMAVHYLDWYLQWRGHPGNKKELLSGTMMMRYNDNIITLLKEFIVTCKKHPNIWEQRILQGVLRMNKHIKVYKLPAEYCVVIKFNGSIPKYIKTPVIVHHQVSRQYKHKG